MKKNANIIKALFIAIAMVTTFSSYARGSRLSSGDQARVRTLTTYLNMNSNTTQSATMVRALAKMDAEAVPTLEKMGVQVTELQGGIYSLYFDVSKLGEIRKVEGVQQVDLAREMRPLGQPSERKGEPRQVIRPV